MQTEREAIELFHLLFLRCLSQNLDPRLYAIKGGCNLRFFFDSIRYSEDIDFDITTIAVGTLQKNINTLLKGASLIKHLSVYKLEIVQVSSPKQTETVQRWKIGIKQKDRALVIPTKVEFSRRKIDPGCTSEPISSLLLHTYRVPTMILPHYQWKTAVTQKIQALINRTQVQARDIFDLYWLFARPSLLKFQTNFDIDKAVDLILSISYDEFSSQVVSYLMPEHISYYRDETVWENIQMSVIDHLKKIFTHETG